MRQIIALSKKFRKGHLVITDYGDDGKIYFTAMRQNANGKVVSVGEYSINTVDLWKFAEGGVSK